MVKIHRPNKAGKILHSLLHQIIHDNCPWERTHPSLECAVSHGNAPFTEELTYHIGIIHLLSIHRLIHHIHWLAHVGHWLS